MFRQLQNLYVVFLLSRWELFIFMVWNMLFSLIPFLTRKWYHPIAFNFVSICAVNSKIHSLFLLEMRTTYCWGWGNVASSLYSVFNLKIVSQMCFLFVLSCAVNPRISVLFLPEISAFHTSRSYLILRRNIGLLNWG